MKTLALGVGILVCFTAGTVSAAITQIPQPNASYTGSTVLIPIGVPDLTVINSLSNAALTMSFSTGLEARTVPPTFTTYNTPPAVETATPRVLKTPGLGATLLTINFSAGLSTFGLEVEPDPNLTNTVFTVTENFFNGATNIGSISLPVNGNGGALLFAGTATAGGPITSVTVTSGATDFAVAQLRYALAAGPAPGIPEPATWMAMMGGLAALAGYRKFRQSRG